MSMETLGMMIICALMLSAMMYQSRAVRWTVAILTLLATAALVLSIVFDAICGIC